MDATTTVLGVSTPTFPTHPAGATYEPTLESLCRVAAWVGAMSGEPAPLTFTALLIAMLYGNDSTSSWLSSYVDTSSINRRALLSEHAATDTSIANALLRATTKELPQLPESIPLFSASARTLLESATQLRDLVSKPENFPPPQPALVYSRPNLDAPHVLAAYAFRTPSNHVAQLISLGFDLTDFQTQVMAFLRLNYLGIPWDRIAADFGDIPEPPATPGPTQNSTVFKSGGAQSLAAPNAPESFTATATSTVSASGTVSSSSPTPTPPPALIGPLIGRYTADDPDATADDLLDIENEASAFARIVAARAIRPPLAIGVFGEWGSGKTYFMRRIQSQVDQLRPAETAESTSLFFRDIVQIRFNAWHYIETNLWASLVEYIFSALDTWIQLKAQGDQKRADLIFNRLATAQQLQIDALENVVTRRAEQHHAELRAQRARQEYAEALAKSARVRPDAYIHALLDTFLHDNAPAKADLKSISEGLGMPRLVVVTERLSEVLTDARSESGRTRLVTRSIFHKLGSMGGIVAILVILFGLPEMAIFLKALAATGPHLAWFQKIEDTTVRLATIAVGLTAIVRFFLVRVRASVDKLTEFDKQLQASIDRQLSAANQSPAARAAFAIEEQLQKAKQAVDTAEHSLVEANARLATARQEFENGTARGRLNDFVRAKVTDGDYAKHLSIIATIRKDFVQLASLMGEANDSAEELKEQRKIRDEATLRVKQFIDWLETATDVQLTTAELHSLFALLDPQDAETVFDAKHGTLGKHFDGTEEQLLALGRSFTQARDVKLPRFSRIVLYIDDLDRCPPLKVVEVLQAVHLLLCFPLFVVVVAVDVRWVSRALHKSYPGLLSGNNGATPEDYLEKIFQIPYWVRPMDQAAAKLYVQKIAAADRTPPTPPIGAIPPAAPASPTQQPPGSIAIPASPVNLPANSSAGAPPPVAGQPAQPANAALQTPEAIGMTLSDWERDTLNAFAPYVGKTPRHAIRFVNVYRLIKTSLAAQFQTTIALESGGTPAARALIPQLAMVTGAPHAAADFFRRLAAVDADTELGMLANTWNTDTIAQALPGHAVVSGVLYALVNLEAPYASTPGTHAKDLLFTALTVQRYSFAARL